MSDAILVLNAGSSSIKFLLFIDRNGNLDPVVRGQIEGIHTAPRFTARGADGGLLGEKSWGEGVSLGHDGAVAYLADFLRGHGGGLELTAVGHRVVHGAMEYAEPVRLDSDVLAVLEKFIPLAPLHQPHNLAPIRLLLGRRPELPQVACFDTAFHSTNPDVARRFALPRELHDAGVRRYGFHGLSYEYVASVLPAHDARAAKGRTIVCHLGNGSSLCALAGGRSIASTMGFTAVDGLPMGTRCGALDPGVLLYLMDQRGMDARAIEKLIYSQSGLLGVSGISSDMRKLLASDDARAKLAVDLYVYRIQRELGSLAAALGGLDALVFTAGIGENSPAVRPECAVACSTLFHLTGMHQAQASVGVQAGIAQNRTLIIFKSAATMNRFIDNGWDVGAGGGAGAAIEGKGAGGAAGGGFASETNVYTLTRTGLQAGFAVAGAKFWKDKELN